MMLSKTVAEGQQLSLVQWIISLKWYENSSQIDCCLANSIFKMMT